MPSPRHRLIETEWPDFGPEPLAAPLVPPEEFAARLDQLRGRMDARRLTHLLVYGDREHFANLAWCSNFDPRFEEAVLILRADGSHPLLVVGNECESYLPISPLWRRGTLRAERYQPFSLLDQPRDASRTLQEIFGGEGIGAGARVGCAGWKYYGHPHRMDTPSYIVDTVRELAGVDQTVDATDLFVHPGYGVRSTCSAAEIAFFEYTNVKASNAMRRIHFALRPGITDHQLLAEARYDGLPLSCHITCKTGPHRVSLASASGNLVERGHTWSANVAGGSFRLRGREDQDGARRLVGLADALRDERNVAPRVSTARARTRYQRRRNDRHKTRISMTAPFPDSAAGAAVVDELGQGAHRVEDLAGEVLVLDDDVESVLERRRRSTTRQRVEARAAPRRAPSPRVIAGPVLDAEGAAEHLDHSGERVGERVCSLGHTRSSEGAAWPRNAVGLAVRP